MPGVMRTVAENRWNNARCVGAETVVTASCADYVLLRETKPADIALMKIEEVLLKCL